MDEFIILQGTQVHFLPSLFHPLYKAAIRAAKPIVFDGIPSKVVSVEHLIALLLLADRLKDRMRVLPLLPLADKMVLRKVLRRFTDEKNPLTGRLRAVLAAGE